MCSELDDLRLEVCLRFASADEGHRLQQIAIASKAHWGYEVDRVRAWAARLDFSVEGLREKEVWVADVSRQAIAWAALIPKGEMIWLDDLWVEPTWIGKGIGSRLFSHALERARQLGGERLEWEAEPNAVGFYERLGSFYARDSEPTLYGRAIPVMGIDLRNGSTVDSRLNLRSSP